MTKLIRNHQKKFVVGLAVVSMIMFVYVGRSGPGGGDGQRDDREVGRAGGKGVNLSEVAQAHSELVTVNQYTRRFDYRQTGGQSASLVDLLLLGRDVAKNVIDHPELFVLLRREATAAGVVPNPAQAQAYMDERLGGTAPDGSTVEPPSPDSDAYAAIHAGVTDLLLVHDHYERVASAIKASRPAVDHVLATEGQTLLLNLIPLPSDAFAAAVAAPTPARMAEQFKRYADVEAGRPDPATNPFGFGYRSPVRVRLQYVRLSRVDLETAVVATRTDYDWEVDARKLYHAHPEQFAVAPPTPPDAPPPPTINPPFDAVRDQALRSIRDPLVKELQDRVQQYLTMTLKADSDAYRAALTATPPAPPPVTALGQPYDARAYLVALTDQVEARFHVRANSDATADLTAKQVSALPGLGQAYAGAAASTASDGTLPGYVSELAATSLADPRAPATVAAMLKPSPVFTEGVDDALDVVRLAGVLPAAPAPNLDAVRPAVEADLRAAAAYDAARAEADRLAAADTPGAMLAAAKDAHRQVIATQPLSMQDMTVEGLTPPLDDAARPFMTQAFGLLDRFDPTARPHPTTVIALPTQRRLIVAQLTFVNARWTPATYYRDRLAAASDLRQQSAAALRLGWFAADAIAQRAGYKPTSPPPGS